MAIISKTIPEDPNVRRARVIVETSKQMFSQLVTGHRRIYAALWRDDPAHPGEEHDPQAVLDLLGTDAAALFAVGSKTIDIILSQDPEAVAEEDYLPPRAPTFNLDGTVTLAAPPPEEP